MRIVLDTNILLRMIEPAHRQHSVTVQAVSILAARGHELMMLPQSLYEYWSVATRPIQNNGLGLTTDEAHRQITGFRQFFVLLRDERAVYPIWERLVSSLSIKGKQCHDARLAAAMERHDIEHLLTINTADFKRYNRIVPLAPASVVDGTAAI